MAQKITGYVKLQIPAGKATPAPPVGPALGQHGVNIAAFTKEFNERTKNDMGMIIPVVITVYADRSFSFITKTCRRPDQEGVQHRVRLRCPQQDQGGHHLQGFRSEDRRDQDEGPERRQPGSRHEHDRRHRPFHGRRGGRLRSDINPMSGGFQPLHTVGGNNSEEPL